MVKRVKVRIDRGAMAVEVGRITEAALLRAAEKTRERAQANIRQKDLIDSGDMLNTMRVEPVPGRPWMHPKAIVGTPVEHAKFQEFGTRAHGPVRASVMVFTPKGGSRPVFAKWVRGVRPSRFMRDALDQLRPVDFER